MQASKGEYMAQWTDGNTFAHYSKRIKKGAQVKLCNTDKETPLMGEFEAVNERSPPSDALKGIEYGKKVLPLEKWNDLRLKELEAKEMPFVASTSIKGYKFNAVIHDAR
jgi:hypothetical protein